MFQQHETLFIVITRNNYKCMFTVSTYKKMVRGKPEGIMIKAELRVIEDSWELSEGRSRKISRLSWIFKSKSLLALSNTEKSSSDAA